MAIRPRLAVHTLDYSAELLVVCLLDLALVGQQDDLFDPGEVIDALLE